MENNESGNVTAASLPIDVLDSIFQFLDTKSKGRAAQVCTSWREVIDSKSLWKNVKIWLPYGNLTPQAERSIFERGIKGFNICRIEPKVKEFLQRIPDLEYLRFTCRTQKNYEMDKIMALCPSETSDGRAESRNSLVRILNFSILDHSSCRNNDGHILKVLPSGMRSLKVLHLDGCPCCYDAVLYNEIDFFAGENPLELLTSVQELRVVYIKPLKEEAFHYISKKFPNLVSLKFDVCRPVANEGLIHLAQLKRLESLTFISTLGITDEGLRHISELANLKSLVISYCGDVTDSGMEFIARLTKLVNLNLGHCHKITDAACNHLNKLTNLRELSLRSAKISDTGVSQLAAGNLKLTKLDLFFCGNVSDQGCLNICQSSFVLHYLDLSCCEVTDEGVSNILDKFPYLEVLDLSWCPLITDKTRKLRKNSTKIIISTK